MESFYAPAYRSSREETLASSRFVDCSPITSSILATMSGYAVVLDRNRQIVGATEGFRKLAGDCAFDALLGSRIGEAIGCEHASRTEDGCGTSPWCSTCGLAVATMASKVMTEPVIRRCVLRIGAGHDASERCFAVYCAPIRCEGPVLHLVQLHELEEARSVPGESAFWDRLREMASDVSRRVRSLEERAGDPRLEGLAAVAADLLDEIDAQMFLLRGTGLSDAFDATFRIGDLLDALRRETGKDDLSKDREIRFVRSCADMVVRGKRRLVRMVLRAMILNALEASRAGDVVDVRVDAEAGNVVFSVRNDEVILPHFALRVFEKHFTTREGTGRGTGTWMMKRIGEDVLGGEVDFTSTPSEGTCFRLKLPSSRVSECPTREGGPMIPRTTIPGISSAVAFSGTGEE